MPRFSNPSAKGGGQSRRNRHLPLASLFQPASSSRTAVRKHGRKNNPAQGSPKNMEHSPTKVPESINVDRQDLENITMDELIGMLALSRKMLKDIKRKKRQERLLQREQCRSALPQTPPPPPPTPEMLLKQERYRRLLPLDDANAVSTDKNDHNTSPERSNEIPMMDTSSSTSTDLMDTAVAMIQHIAPRTAKSMIVGSMLDIMPDLDPTESSLAEEDHPPCLMMESLSSSMQFSSLTLMDDGQSQADCASETSEDMSFFDALAFVCNDEEQESGQDSPCSDKRDPEVSLQECYLLAMLVLLFFLAKNRLTGKTDNPHTEEYQNEKDKTRTEPQVDQQYCETNTIPTVVVKSQSQPDIVSISSSCSLSSGCTEGTTLPASPTSPGLTRTNRIVVTKSSQSQSMPLVPPCPPPSSRSFYQHQQKASLSGRHRSSMPNSLSSWW